MKLLGARQQVLGIGLSVCCLAAQQASGFLQAPAVRGSRLLNGVKSSTPSVTPLARVRPTMAITQNVLDGVFGQPGTSGFGRGTTAQEVGNCFSKRIQDRVFFLTGGTSGIGNEMAKEISKHGGILVLAGRNPTKLQETRKELLNRFPKATVHTVTLDLRDMKSVKSAVDQWRRLKLPGIDALICDAGIAFAPYAVTSDGLEEHFAANYLGHFLLTRLLLPDLARAGKRLEKYGDKARIVNVASLVHRVAPKQGVPIDDLGWFYTEYNPVTAYGSSKLAVILSTVELAKRLERGNLPISVNAVHPGFVSSGIGRSFAGSWLTGPLYSLSANIVGKNSQQGAATPLYVALAPEVRAFSGGYFSNCNLAEWGHPVQQNDPDLSNKLWDVTCDLVKQPKNVDPKQVLPKNLPF